MNISFQADEDIEDVILKLSSSNMNIRRAPARGSRPQEQYDKHETESLEEEAKEDIDLHKDGSKTHVPVGQQPIAIPELAIFEKRHKGETIFEEIAKEHFGEESTAEEDEEDDDEEPKAVRDNLVLVSSKSFVGESSTQESSTVSSVDTTETEPSTDESEEETSETRTETLAPTTPTTSYNTATFYHTPVLKAKKEKSTGFFLKLNC
ncbi:hypothetical protein OESDEN_14542 [Oesophagostomum dentatum]|uniref:Uncharacterized protein n=1 Tax=Oesophagostomum dentatum TaxID=61180 RepID=A0A0B1SLC5_OESDE|nr:hypothetical protein OESDEN_14542 [Oesophagostomum dentatum]